MNNCIIKTISKVYLIILIHLISLLVISNILVFAEDKQQQNLNINPHINDSSFFSFFEKIKNVTENHIVNDNSIKSATDYNFIMAGDWYCNEESKKNNK